MSKKEERKDNIGTIKEKGITLIALIITIIILIILASIGIRAVIGDHGLFQMTQEAAENMRIAEYREGLVEIGAVLAEKQIFDDLKGRAYLEEFKKRVEESEQFKGMRSAEIIGDTGEGEEKLRVVTKEGYVFYVTEKDVKNVGKVGEGEGFKPLPDIKEGSIIIELDKNEWTHEIPIHATITVNDVSEEDLSGLIVEYTKDPKAQTGWTNYIKGSKIDITANGVIIVRVKNNIGEILKTATKKINIIDTVAPDQPTSQITETTTNSITVKAIAKDGIAPTDKPEEESGVAKIIFALQGEGEPQEKAVIANKTEQASADCTFTALNENNEYTIIVKAVDKAGNESEVDNIKIVLAKANYSISNNGKKIYYEKLSEAYKDAIDKGGEFGGGTIVLEKDVTEVFATSFEIAKTIQIDTNNKTLKIEATENFQNSEDRNGLILINSGTFTIKGPGNIVSEAAKWFMTAYGGNINIEGAVNIQTAGHAVILQHGYTSNLTITDSTINVSSMRSTSLARNGKCNDYKLKNIC